MAVGCLGSENCSAWWNGGAMGHEMVMFGWMAVPWVVECRAVGRCRGSRNDGGWWDGAMCLETAAGGGTAPWVAKRWCLVGRRCHGSRLFFFRKYYYITNMRKTMHGNAWFRRGRAWGKAKTMRFRFVFEKKRDKKRQTTHEHMWFRTGRARSK